MKNEPKIYAITLIATDLAKVETFYRDVFGRSPVYQDEVSRVFKFGETLINVLDRSDAVNLFAPATTAEPNFAHHSMMTMQVEDVDAEAARLQTLGVELNYGPINQPWGIRVVTFVDPAGQLWEFSQPLA
jgi:predicted enzyme related to lactoylglutathione lyase